MSLRELAAKRGMTGLEPDDDVLQPIGEGGIRPVRAALDLHQTLDVLQDFGQQLVRQRIKLARTFEIFVQFRELGAQRFWVHGFTP